MQCKAREKLVTVFSAGVLGDAAELVRAATSAASAAACQTSAASRSINQVCGRLGMSPDQSIHRCNESVAYHQEPFDNNGRRQGRVRRAPARAE